MQVKRIFVFVQNSAESVASSDVEPGDPVGIGEWRGQRTQWSGVGDALVRAVLIVELLEVRTLLAAPLASTVVVMLSSVLSRLVSRLR